MIHDKNYNSKLDDKLQENNFLRRGTKRNDQHNNGEKPKILFNLFVFSKNCHYRRRSTDITMYGNRLNMDSDCLTFSCNDGDFFF